MKTRCFAKYCSLAAAGIGAGVVVGLAGQASASFAALGGDGQGIDARVSVSSRVDLNSLASASRPPVDVLPAGLVWAGQDEAMPSELGKGKRWYDRSTASLRGQREVHQLSQDDAAPVPAEVNDVYFSAMTALPPSWQQSIASSGDSQVGPAMDGGQAIAAPIRYFEDFNSNQLGAEWASTAGVGQMDNFGSFAGPFGASGQPDLFVQTRPGDPLLMTFDLNLVTAKSAAANGESVVVTVTANGSEVFSSSLAELAEAASGEAPATIGLQVAFTPESSVTKLSVRVTGGRPAVLWGMDNVGVDTAPSPTTGELGGFEELFDTGLIGGDTGLAFDNTNAPSGGGGGFSGGGGGRSFPPGFDPGDEGGPDEIPAPGGALVMMVGAAAACARRRRP